MSHKVILSIIASCIVFFGFASIHAEASDDVAVTGNGSESSNTVQTSTTSTTSVQSSNNSSINNSVTTSTNTGGNTASNNTNGDVNLVTGDSATTTSITNEGNTSVVNQDCCNSSSGYTTISGNGSNTTNSVDSSINTSTTATINNTATVNNIIKGYANTGNNKATGNVGDVNITTGRINAYQSIENNFNYSTVAIPGNTSQTEDITISGNGFGSANSVNRNTLRNTNIAVNNSAYFLNDTTLILNTGNNEAKVNVGNVDIKTGDIIAKVDITNKANVSDVKVTCCEENKPEAPQPQPSTPPTTVTTTSSNPTTTGGSTQPAAAVLAAGKVLPATGGYWMVIFLIGNIVMLLLGAFLRLRSGRSPGFVYAV